MIRALPALLALALAAPLAAAHASHPACGEASHDTNDNGFVWSYLHANAWTERCVGAAASWDLVACAAAWDEASLLPVHAHALDGDGCRTGVLVELP